MMESNNNNVQTETTETNNIMATSSSSSIGKGQARLLGSAVAGVSELSIFHPVDTIAKRLMTNESRIVIENNISASTMNLNRVVFKDAHSLGAYSKITSLFPGIGFGAAYKILQRIYKFGGQPIVRDWMKRRYGREVEETFGPQTGRTLLSATAGSIIGIGEVILLPLDALKVKAQTAPEQLHGRGVVDIFYREGWSLYRGAGWTVARNAPGSFALFGGNALCKSLMGIRDESHMATWTQDAIASCAGAVASITVAQPLDVIKTRIQNRPFDSPESGVSIVANLIRREGLGAFFKGLVPKLLVVGPKLVFSFTVAQHTIAYFTKNFG